MKLYPYELRHIQTLRALAPECMVLLKADGSSFPLKTPCAIALYGNGARRTVKGGTGSGDVNSRFYVTVEEGLENAGFSITTKSWLDAYDATCKSAQIAFQKEKFERIKKGGLNALLQSTGDVMHDPDSEMPVDACADAEAIIYVLARNSGEGADRTPTQGDLLLTDREVYDILTLSRIGKPFMLVLNVGGVVDLSPVMEVENILILSQLGVVTGDAFADVLLGKAYPSGKLSTTWAAWDDYCHEGDFGLQDETCYREGIYVGYRYFDAAGKRPLFPFGYGASYTSFVIDHASAKLSGAEVAVAAMVRNTGNYAGKEVVQLYVQIPEGKFDQPERVLAAFAKTQELLPGEEELVCLKFPMEQLASFDVTRRVSVLEAGDYILQIGTDCRNTTGVAAVRLENEVITHEHNSFAAEPVFVDWRPEKRAAPEHTLPVLRMDAVAIETKKPQKIKVDETALEFVKKLSDTDLALLCIGNFRDGDGPKNILGSASLAVPGASGETTDRIAGVPSLVMPDGPAGLRLMQKYGKDEDGIFALDNNLSPMVIELLGEEVVSMFGLSMEEALHPKQRTGTIIEQYCTAIPIGTALAQSWNENAAKICGDLVGEEMEMFGAHLWLAPAMNIHRSPLCGRNFEYYSEDPILSGKMAAAITRGVQAHNGRGTTIKHFCCNNQETNRLHNNSRVSERALREIYLKGFEICIREAQPEALMTSYNLLNGVHTSECNELLDGILRGEWGYEGLIMTDWVIQLAPTEKKYPTACAQKTIKAGNELFMPGCRKDYDAVLNALHGKDDSVRISREELEIHAASVVRAAWKLCGKNNEEVSV